MSTWLHFAGIIRFDNICLFGEDTVEQVEEYIRKGSIEGRYGEGETHVKAVRYSGGLPWMAVSFWGDLRDCDHEDIPKLWQWINSKHKWPIRDGCCVISVEGWNLDDQGVWLCKDGSWLDPSMIVENAKAFTQLIEKLITGGG